MGSPILNNRCLVHLAVGAFGRAAADATTALTLFDRLGQDLESVQACHNHAVIAFCRGDVPDALRRLELADRRYRALGVAEPNVVIDRAQMLLAAGLASEAVAAAEAALAEPDLQPVKRAELLFVAAKASLAAGELGTARRWAAQSRRLFHVQQRETWEARSRFLACQARYLSGERTEGLLAAVLELAARLTQLRAEEACLAHLLAGRLARHRGQHAVATASFAAAARRRHGSPLARATGWLALAMRAAEQNAGRTLFSACAHGLDALDEHRLVFGAAELRAMATFHGRDLATLALEAAHRNGSPRSMLAWSERWRATSLAEPSVQPPADPELEGELAALRDAVRRLEEQVSGGAASGPARQQRDHYEVAVRRRRLGLSGSVNSQPRLDLDELFAALGEIRLIALVGIGGILYGLTVGNGRVRKHRIGELAAAMRELDFARFALRRAAHARAGGVAALGEQLQRALLGPAAGLLTGGPVVIVPPATLHSAPWSLLPALAGVPVSISGSAAMWLRAKASAGDPPADRRVTLVLGPNLSSGGAEISSLAELHSGATVLGSETGNGPATAERVLTSMTGAWLAHIAAHGSFRADSPLFSALRVDGGPLFVHDFDRLSRAPHRVVLSACDSGIGAPVGADELLGTVSGLLRAGSVGVLASVVPVNDVAATPFMVTVHQALLNGKSLPEAALIGRLAASGDPLTSATAASFTVWGV